PGPQARRVGLAGGVTHDEQAGHPRRQRDGGVGRGRGGVRRGGDRGGPGLDGGLRGGRVGDGLGGGRRRGHGPDVGGAERLDLDGVEAAGERGGQVGGEAPVDGHGDERHGDDGGADGGDGRPAGQDPPQADRLLEQVVRLGGHRERGGHADRKSTR